MSTWSDHAVAVCKKCDGNGYHPAPFEGHQFWFAPFTLGLSLIREKVVCRVCNGSGKVPSSFAQTLKKHRKTEKTLIK